MNREFNILSKLLQAIVLFGTEVIHMIFITLWHGGCVEQFSSRLVGKKRWLLESKSIWGLLILVRHAWQVNRALPIC